MNAFASVATTTVDQASAPACGLGVRSFGLSDTGRRRESNEDCFAIAELAATLRVHHTNLPNSGTSFSPHRAYVFLIADGMGGKNAGEVASNLSVASIQDFLLTTLKRFSNLQANEEAMPYATCKTRCVRPIRGSSRKAPGIPNGMAWARP